MHTHVQSFDSVCQCSRVTHKGEVNGLQNCLWYNQLCQLETHWCWFHCHCCCFPPFDSSVFSFIPPFLSPIAISLSSSLSLCSEPSTVTMDPSKPCLKARGGERQSLCVRDCVCERRGGERERDREREGESCPVQYREQPPQQWMMLHQRGGRQTGRIRHSWPRFKLSWKGRAWLAGEYTQMFTCSLLLFMSFFFHLSFFFFLGLLSSCIYFHPIVILHPCNCSPHLLPPYFFFSFCLFSHAASSVPSIACPVNLAPSVAL